MSHRWPFARCSYRKNQLRAIVRRLDRWSVSGPFQFYLHTKSHLYILHGGQSPTLPNMSFSCVNAFYNVHVREIKDDNKTTIMNITSYIHNKKTTEKKNTNFCYNSKRQSSSAQMFQCKQLKQHEVEQARTRYYNVFYIFLVFIMIGGMTVIFRTALS